MENNTLSNLWACVYEFDTEQSMDVQACAEFEEVAIGKKKPALMALGGEKLRQVWKTLGVAPQDDYEAMKTKLMTHFTPKKNTSAERFKFFNMRPETVEETHDHWVTRLQQKVSDCEFDNETGHHATHTQQHPPTTNNIKGPGF